MSRSSFVFAVMSLSLGACKFEDLPVEPVARETVSIEGARLAKSPDVIAENVRAANLDFLAMSNESRNKLAKEFVFRKPRKNISKIVVRLKDPEVSLVGTKPGNLTMHPLFSKVFALYGGELTKVIPQLNAVIISFKDTGYPSTQRDKMIEAKIFLEKSVLVYEVHGDAIIKLAATPNDKELAKQWHLNNAGFNYQASSIGGKAGLPGVDIAAIKGWDVRSDASNIIVAMTDTGINRSNPDLAANIWRNPGETGRDAYGRDKSTNSMDDDGNGYVDDINGWNCVGNNNMPDDDHGHGTGTAGVVGAVGNNALGVAGVAWKVKLAALKFLDADGYGTASDAAECLNYAIKMKMDIINVSWAGDTTTLADTEPMIKLAEASGVLIVAAAGNSNLDVGIVGNESYPASYPASNIISVGSIDPSGVRSYFSNFSQGKIHVMAPGESIWTLSKVNGQFVPQHGTSFAAPVVSGIAALLKAYFIGRDPEKATPQKIRDNIIATSVPLANLGKSSQAGGYVSLKNALAYDPLLTASPSTMDIPAAGGPLDSCPLAVEKFNPKFTARLMLPGALCLSGMTPIKSYEQIIQNRQCCGIDLTPCVNGPQTWARWLIYDAFARQPKAGEVETIVASITRKSKTPSMIAAATYAADEIYLKNINTIHQNIFNKAPSYANTTLWLSQFRGGIGSEIFMAQLMQTSEYYAIAGGKNDTWVRYIYQNVLGRDPDVASFKYWVAALAKGMSRYNVALAIVRSAEYRKNFVIIPAFQGVLRRMPTASDLAYWQNAMKASKTPELVRGLLAASLEYYNKKSVCPAPP